MNCRLFLTTGVVLLLTSLGLLSFAADPPSKKEAVLIPTKGAKGVIKGRVTLSGMPNLEELNKKQMESIRAVVNAIHSDAHCLKGDTEYQGLVVKDGGVRYAVVWLRPGPGPDDHFVMTQEEVEAIVKKRQEEKKAVMDQPFCAFQPHVISLFPQWYDLQNEKLEPTGETLLVKNTAPIGHNVKVGLLGYTSPVLNMTIPPGEALEIKQIKQSYVKPWVFNCDIHKFMFAYAWAFEHPFAAVTDETGHFIIENVPTNKELYIVCWHELAERSDQPGFLNPGKANGDKITVKEGEPLTKDFELKVK